MRELTIEIREACGMCKLWGYNLILEDSKRWKHTTIATIGSGAIIICRSSNIAIIWVVFVTRHRCSISKYPSIALPVCLFFPRDFLCIEALDRECLQNDVKFVFGELGEYGWYSNYKGVVLVAIEKELVVWVGLQLLRLSHYLIRRESRGWLMRSWVSKCPWYQLGK